MQWENAMKFHTASYPTTEMSPSEMREPNLESAPHLPLYYYLYSLQADPPFHILSCLLHYKLLSWQNL